MKNLPTNKHIFGVYLSAVLLLFVSVAVGVLLGASEMSLADFVSAIAAGKTDSAAYRIFVYVRLPRVLAALTCGAALSVAGATVQCALANRLASPSIIGINAGAGLAVTVCAAFGVVGGFGLSLSAFLGALGAAFIVSMGAKKWGASRGTVILLGVALNSLLGAASDVIVTFYPDAALMSNDFRVGDMSAATYQKILPAAILIILAIGALISLCARMDVLMLGNESAVGLGLNANLTRALLLMLCALLAGCAVSVCGLLSFVGLLVPHAVRAIAGTASKRLIPLCALFGAGLVTLCDALSRIVFAPYEVPVGVIFAFVGAPFFVFILIKGKRGRQDD